MFLCGGFAGAVAWSAASPADLINSRRQARYGELGAKGETMEIAKNGLDKAMKRSVRDEIRLVLREEGVQAFWKGYSLQVARGFVGYGAFAIGYAAVVESLRPSAHTGLYR